MFSILRNQKRFTKKKYHSSWVRCSKPLNLEEKASTGNTWLTKRALIYGVLTFFKMSFLPIHDTMEINLEIQ